MLVFFRMKYTRRLINVRRNQKTKNIKDKGVGWFKPNTQFILRNGISILKKVFEWKLKLSRYFSTFHDNRLIINEMGRNKPRNTHPLHFEGSRNKDS